MLYLQWNPNFAVHVTTGFKFLSTRLNRLHKVQRENFVTGALADSRKLGSQHIRTGLGKGVENLT